MQTRHMKVRHESGRTCSALAQAPTLPVAAVPVGRSLPRTPLYEVPSPAPLNMQRPLPTAVDMLRLFAGEEVCYRTSAAWCGTPLMGSRFYRYQVKDEGMLLFTDRRMIYLGRRGRLVLEYEHLLRVTCVRGALAFQADYWTRRECFEVEHLINCAHHVEAILTNFKRRLIYQERLNNAHYAANREMMNEETLLLPIIR